MPPDVYELLAQQLQSPAVLQVVWYSQDLRNGMAGCQLVTLIGVESLTQQCE